MFDVSSTVLGAIMNCEWIGEGMGRKLFDVSSTMLDAVLIYEWTGEGGEKLV